MREFFRGVGDFIGGFRWYRTTRAPMVRALLPGVAVWTILFVGVVLFIVNVTPIIVALTPFVGTWIAPLQIMVRVGGALGLIGAVIYLAIRLYGVVTPIVGEAFYDRLRVAVSRELGRPLPKRRVRALAQTGEAAKEVVQSIPIAIMLFLVGLIPVVGFVISWATAATMSGRRLGHELVTASLTAHAQPPTRQNRARIVGFGVAANLASLVPFAGVFAMPAAVAGATTIACRIDPPPL